MSHYGPPSPHPGQPGPYQSSSYGWNPQGGSPGEQAPYPQPGGSPYMPVSQPGTLPLQPLTLGNYFNSLFSTLRKSPGLFFGAALIFGSIAAIFAATGDFLLTQSLNIGQAGTYAQLDQQLDQIAPGTSIGVMVASLFSSVVMVVGQTFTWGMYSTMVARGAIGMKTTLGQGFRLLRGQWGRLIGLALLMIVGAILLSALFLVLLLLFIAVLFSGATQDDIGAVLLVFLGALVIGFLVVAFGTYFMIRWLLVGPAIVIENIGVFAGLRRSWRLTRGHFWRTLGITLLMGVIFSIVSMVIVTPLSFVSMFVAVGAGTEGEFTTAMVVTNMLVVAVSSLVTFIILSMQLLPLIFFYFDYRFRKEGLGLEFQQLAAQHAGQAPTDRFDTSFEERRNSSDEDLDLIPGRDSIGLRPGPAPGYGQQPPQSGPPQQGPPQPPGPYR